LRRLTRSATSVRLRSARRCAVFQALGGCDEPGLDGGDLVGGKAVFDGGFERSHGGGGCRQSPLPFAGQHDLEDATVGRVLVSLDQAVPLQRCEHSVHRLWSGVASPRQVGARHSGVSREHAQHAVLDVGQSMSAQGRVHGPSKRLPGLAQEVAAVALYASIALSDAWCAHASKDIKALTQYKGLVIVAGT
jgi:hypothetical protein